MWQRKASWCVWRQIWNLVVYNNKNLTLQLIFYQSNYYTWKSCSINPMYSVKPHQLVRMWLRWWAEQTNTSSQHYTQESALLKFSGCSHILVCDGLKPTVTSTSFELGCIFMTLKPKYFTICFSSSWTPIGSGISRRQDSSTNAANDGPPCEQQ